MTFNLLLLIKVTVLNKILVFILILVINSCCKEGYELSSYKMSDEDKRFVPFSEDEKLTYKHSNGFVFPLDVVSVTSQTHQVGPNSCEDNYYSYDSQTVVLKSAVPELYLEIETYATTYSPIITITYNRSVFKVNKKALPQYNELVVGDKTYTNVYKATFVDDNLENTIYPSTLYYAPNVGVIQIKMTNNDTFTIQ